MNAGNLPVNLSDAQIEEFGRELDAIREEVVASRGAQDRRYILRVIKTQRSLGFLSRLLMFFSLLFLPAWAPLTLAYVESLVPYASPIFWTLLVLGVLGLGVAKILENMEIGHNVLHAQWDWMKDETIQSSTWEWDHICPSTQWQRSHNVRHHTWTNVLGKDPDVGYGLLRMSADQRWRPFYLGQTIYALILAILFEWGVAIQELELGKLFSGRATLASIRPMLVRTGRKAAAQMLKDFVLWPLLGVLLALPFLLVGLPAISLLTVFGAVLAANAAACLVRNLWTYMIIFCGHFPDGVYVFTKQQVEQETRARWYVRQLLGSCNIRGGRAFNILSGNLSHQIEHHLFPDLPSNRYPALALRVKALTARYGLPYNVGSLTRQFGTALWKIARLSFPGGAKTLAVQA